MSVIPRFIASVFFILSLHSYAGGKGWFTDYELAKKEAQKQQKDILVDFTGSDWCTWCIRLNKEVFEHGAFRQGVADTFVLLELDYPQDKSGQSEELKKQNAMLQKSYAVNAFPTILLLDAQGRPYAKTAYQAGGPELYLKHLEELRAVRIERDKALAVANTKQGVEKAKELTAVLKSLPQDQLDHYKALSDEITRLDPQDESGLKKNRAVQVAREKLDADIMAVLQGSQKGSISELIDGFLQKHEVSDAVRMELLVT